MATKRASKTRRAPLRGSSRAKVVERRTGRTKARKARTGAAARPTRSEKRTIAIGEFAVRLKALLAEFPTLYAIWDKPEMDPAFREELMVAIARQNDAPYCNWAHRTWAESMGASEQELAKIEASQLGALAGRKRAALEYVTALAAADFKRVPRELRARMESFYTQREIGHIELVAAVMDLVNRSANTYEAMLSRLQGKPGEKTRITDEMFFSSVFLTVAPPLVLLLARYSGRSFVDTTRSLVGYVQDHYAQKATRPSAGSD
jgi:AhpD family alkylhydroperoxidase